MHLLQGLRDWIKHSALSGQSGPSGEIAYNKTLFETQVRQAVQYRQAHQAQDSAASEALEEDSIPASPPIPTLTIGQFEDAHAERQGRLSPLLAPQDNNSLAHFSPIAAHQAGMTVVRLLLDQAKGYVSESRWDKAIATCKKVVALDPQEAEAHRLMGEVFQGMEQPYEAMGCYAQALALQPESAAIYTNLGRLYHERQEWEQAISYYQQAIDWASTSSTSEAIATANRAKAGLTVAQIQYQRQTNTNHHQVDAIYQSLSLSPETFTAEEHCEMGQLLLQQEDRENAMECFYRAVECQSSCVPAHTQLAELLEERQQWRESVFHYKQALQSAQQALESTTQNQGKPYSLIDAALDVQEGNAQHDEHG